MFIEQRARHIAREEAQLLIAEHVAAAIEAEQGEQVLNVRQTAELLGVPPGTIYDWIKAGKLQSLIVGRNSIRLKRGHVLAFDRAQTQPDGHRKYARRKSRKEVAYA